MANPYLIVTCDGGGMRGLITALLLDDLQTKTSFLSKVNLFAGTSTGSFIALGLASGQVSTSSLISLYESDGQSIFTPYTPPSGQVSAAARRLAAAQGTDAISFNPCNWVNGFCYAMYMNDTSSPLYSTVSKLFTDSGTGDPLTLGNLKTDAVVTTNVLWNAAAKAWLPTLVGSLPGSSYGSMPLADAALSSGAAPIYFPPYWNATLNSYCADGGTFANNPASAAVTAALQAGVLTVADLPNVYLLSLNTGVVQNGMPPSYINSLGAQNMWILEWFASMSAPVPSEPLISMMFDTVSDIDSMQMQALLGAGNFMRPQGPVLTQPYSLDDWKDVATLESVTSDYINASNGQPTDWENVVSWVQTNFT